MSGSVQVPLDELRKLSESNIRIEGTTNEIKKDLSRFEFRLDSHGQRLDTLETKLIHADGVREGRQDVRDQIDKKSLAYIGAIATVGAGAITFLLHKLGLS